MLDNACEDEAAFILFLPRNLSYAEESYLDNFSVVSSFVNVAKAERENLVIQQRRESVRKMECEFSPYAVKVKDDAGAAEEGESTENQTSEQNHDGTYDTQSEEGVFVNMMDDLDSLESPNETLTSDNMSFDSINSLEETNSDVPNAKVKELNGKTEGDCELKKALSEGSIGTRYGPTLAKLEFGLGGNTASEAECRKYLLQVPDSPVFEEPEFNFSKAQLRKSSSLKTNKTPPGTPRRKKMVRFADAMGLDLESIRHVLNTDAPPKIPASAMADLMGGLEHERMDLGSRYLDICFPQPGAMDNFNQKVMARKVSLENCLITDLSITGVVRVANIGYHKCVRVRYSINSWVTFYDVMASYIQNSCDGPTDRFSFTIVSPAAVGPGSRIEFAVSYTVNDTVYWDSNDGQNYAILCYAKTTPTEHESSWVHFV